MTTLAGFRTAMVLPIVERIQNGAQHVLATTDMIPVCGIVFYRSFNGDDVGGSNYTFYLAAENGELAQYEDVECKTIHDEIFNAEEAKQRVAAMLGIEPAQIGFSEGDERDDHDCCVRWKFLHLTIAEFERLRKPKKVSVIAERGFQTPTQRWVAPNAVRIRNAGFDFDIKTAKARFVMTHNNSIEYVTDTGIKVFDNRRSHVGFSDGGIYGTGEAQPIIIREDCLRDFLYDIWRGHKAKRSADKETERLRDYAGWALDRLALHADNVARCEGRIIAEGIELLYGEPFVPAVEVFGRWYTRHGHVSSWNKRMFLRDAGNSHTWYEGDKKLDTRYVVLTD